MDILRGMGLVLGLVLAAILKFIDARTLKFIFTLVTVALFQRHLSKVCKSSERTYSVDIVGSCSSYGTLWSMPPF